MRLFKMTTRKAGMAPGSLVPSTEQQEKIDVSVSFIDYNKDEFCAEELMDSSGSPELKQGYKRLIMISGINDLDIIRNFGDLFDLHPLVQEDIANSGHPVKHENWDNTHFIILKELSFNEEFKVEATQVSLIISRNTVVVFFEGKRHFLEPVIKRMKTGKGRIRTAGSGYLAYCIMDSIVDHYFSVLEKMNEEIENLEEEVFDRRAEGIIESIHLLKRQTLIIRRLIRPLQDVFSSLIRDDSVHFPESDRMYLQDVYDHILHVLETLDSFRELLSACLDSAMTADGNRMNEIMKVLTIIATIFIPLTFVAGIYGMNFETMPELKLSYGYPGVLLIMFAVFVGMVIWFKRKKWL